MGKKKARTFLEGVLWPGNDFKSIRKERTDKKLTEPSPILHVVPQ